MAGEPIQGFDVQVSIVGPNGPELAGSWEQVDFRISEDVEKYIEMGERIGRTLDGEITISGTLRRGWRNMNLIQRVWGVSAIRRGVTLPASPRFEISFSVNAPAKGLVGRYKLENVKFTEFSLSAAAGKGVVKGDLPFQAEGISAA